MSRQPLHPYRQSTGVDNRLYRQRRLEQEFDSFIDQYRLQLLTGILLLLGGGFLAFNSWADKHVENQMRAHEKSLKTQPPVVLSGGLALPKGTSPEAVQRVIRHGIDQQLPSVPTTPAPETTVAQNEQKKQ